MDYWRTEKRIACEYPFRRKIDAYESQGARGTSFEVCRTREIGEKKKKKKEKVVIFSS
jgi:hypothetical protein